MKRINGINFIGDQTGVALVTVVMISVLLLIACIAILTAVGAHSRNVTDVLSESKAYYAAESGIQATINVLRGNTDTTTDTNDDIDYKKAVKPATSNYSGDPSTSARLSGWMTYNYPTSGTPDRVVLGDTPGTYTPLSGTAFKVEVSDPDNTQDYTTFNTNGYFTNSSGQSTGVTLDVANSIQMSIGSVTGSTVIFATNTQNIVAASFNLTRVGASTTAVTNNFQVDLRFTAPRDVSAAMRGKVVRDSAGGVTVSFDAAPGKPPIYKIAGSEVKICESPVSCTKSSFTVAQGVPLNIYLSLTPVEPYRIKILSTGYGPNGAMKRLEAVIQRNFFNELSSAAAVANIGPFAGSTFSPGNSNNVTYTGADQSGTGNVIPAIGFTDPAAVENAVNMNTNANISPAPALLSSDLPDWQRTPAGMDLVVNQLRISAQNSVRYFPSGNQPTSFGNFAAGTGLTFCDGNCTFTGQGGGILVVTGKLTVSGNFSFRGLIIVTGAGGITRNGGGQGEIIGNIVVAPYNPSNLAAGFLPPQYDMNGGGGSEVIYSSQANVNFNGQNAVSDFVQGVSEK